MGPALLALPAIFGAVGLAAKTPKVPKPLPIATRDDARGLAERERELSRRRGGAADILTGTSGAEAGPGSAKELLGS